jgi:hypothetical protein
MNNTTTDNIVNDNKIFDIIVFTALPSFIVSVIIFTIIYFCSIRKRVRVVSNYTVN